MNTRNDRPGYVQIFSLSLDHTGSTQLVPRGFLNGKKADDMFGAFLDMSASGECIAVGVPGGGSARQGLVRVYQNVQNFTWASVGRDILAPEMGQLTSSLPVALNFISFPATFGFSLAISADGNTVAIGDPCHSYDVLLRLALGAVHVYR